jgi:IS5 family transposase
MKRADAVLADEDIVVVVYEALAKRRPKSRCRGRRGTPADVVLRMLTLKHIRNWSYDELERKVRANLVCRDFGRLPSRPRSVPLQARRGPGRRKSRS